MAALSAEEMRAIIRRAVNQERERQDEKWGEQNHDPIVWMAVLTEEVGEATQQALKARFGTDRERHLRRFQRELVQAAAVCVAAIESLNRNELGITEEDV